MASIIKESKPNVFSNFALAAIKQHVANILKKDIDNVISEAVDQVIKETNLNINSSLRRNVDRFVDTMAVEITYNKVIK